MPVLMMAHFPVQMLTILLAGVLGFAHAAKRPPPRKLCGPSFSCITGNVFYASTHMKTGWLLHIAQLNCSTVQYAFSGAVIPAWGFAHHKKLDVPGGFLEKPGGFLEKLSLNSWLHIHFAMPHACASTKPLVSPAATVRATGVGASAAIHTQGNPPRARLHSLTGCCHSDWYA
jgi:hypothetical protein